MKDVPLWKTFTPVILCIVTAAVGYWASTLSPSPDVVKQGAWTYDYSKDPISATRLAIVGFGLISPILAALFAFGDDPRDKRNLLHLALVLACVSVCFSFGWRNMPYWANGVYQTDLGKFDYIDMDPKALPPMVWIGELWRLLVLLFPVFLFILSVAVFPLGIWAWKKQGVKMRSLLVILMVGFAWVSIFWRVQDYTLWLLD